MGTFRDQYIEVGLADSTFADLDSDGLPDTSSVTFRALSVVFDSGIISGLSRRFNRADHVRVALGEAAASQEGFINATGSSAYEAANGTFIGEEFGDLSFRLRLRGPGSGNALASTALLELLSTTMEVHTPSSATTAVTAAGANAGVFDVGSGDGANFTAGEVISAVVNNRVEYAIVTDIATDTITVSPKFSQALDSGDTVRHCVSFYPKTGTPSARDAFIRFNAGGQSTAADIRRLACGCRVTGVAVEFEQETAFLRITVSPTVILPDDTNASVSASSELAGPAAQFVGSYSVIGADHSAASVPVTSARTALNLYGWSAEMTFGVAPTTPSQSVITRTTGTEVTRATCTATLTSTYTSTLRNLLRLGETRNLVLGMGPAAAGAGACLVIASAGPSDGANAVSGGDNDRTEMQTVVTAQEWAGVDASTALAVAPFQLAIPMG
jgi:hypothetical protein